MVVVVREGENCDDFATAIVGDGIVDPLFPTGIRSLSFSILSDFKCFEWSLALPLLLLLVLEGLTAECLSSSLESRLWATADDV